MAWLTDTNILLRMIQTGNPMQEAAINALGKLRTRREDLCVVPQNLVEFWAVATRPVIANGFGFTIEETSRQIEQIKSHFLLIKDDGNVFDNWEKLVRSYGVSGKPTHDAHIVAAMQTHNIQNILTFNHSDFSRYADIINVSTPADLVTET